MPFAMFYDLKNGLALHQANDEVLGSLGKRASGGCTRLSPRTAQDLFYRVQMTERTPVPVIQPNGQPERDAQGNIVYTTYFKSGGGTLPSYSALIIIHNVED